MTPRQLLAALIAHHETSQNALAQRAKVAQSTISRFIAGAELSYRNASKLAAELRIPVSALFSDVDSSKVARELDLQPVNVHSVAEVLPHYAPSLPQWPFSAELLHAVRGCSADELQRLESVMRAHLGMPTDKVGQAREPSKRAGT